MPRAPPGRTSWPSWAASPGRGGSPPRPAMFSATADGASSPSKDGCSGTEREAPCRPDDVVLGFVTISPTGPVGAVPEAYCWFLDRENNNKMALKRRRCCHKYQTKGGGLLGRIPSVDRPQRPCLKCECARCDGALITSVNPLDVGLDVVHHVGPARSMRGRGYLSLTVMALRAL